MLGDKFDKMYNAFKRFCTEWDEPTDKYKQQDVEKNKEKESVVEEKNNNDVVPKVVVHAPTKKSYFTIDEMCRSSKAEMIGLRNVPNEEQRKNLEALIKNVLDPLRERFGYPISVTSGFRSSSVNAAVGGAKNSQHTKGEAADICYIADPTMNKRLFDLIIENGVYDQVIWEKGNDRYPSWVHVSYKMNGSNRRERLRTKDGKSYYRI